jgi:hypothetical protein
MPNTFELIQAYTVGSGGQSSIDFTSISSSYTDLCLQVSVRSAGTSIDNLAIKINTSAANFSGRYVVGNGATASSASVDIGGQIGLVNGTATTSSTFTNVSVYIPNYAGSTNKSYSADAVTENNATTAYALMIAGLWSQTAAINAISVYGQSANLAQHSTAYLYGVKNA